MDIKILGTGCPNCQRLEQNTKQALEELKIEAVVEKVTDIQDIIGYGIMSTPALVVDGNVLLAGMVPSVNDIKEKIENYIK
ncbi:MAG: thioredoxin family protein [Candidatus Moranbacteria bacterium]|nr:thioredoxin family protein [bacterium]MDP1833907.1 thioredoxin family protein [Candidatus Moranbacteria bacterium]